ncbi:MAG TPA: hypothetical protein VFQ75_04660 [Candidatus Limnocylindrales bacterium]|jgi:hypothetical protein|nr:hypothetical protein [Candidatus Limnocylindrales bacterium]
MSPSSGGSAEPVPVEAGKSSHPPAAGHEHAWSMMRFELVDDRPFVHQACEGCGAVRRYRAWDRTWTPGAGEVRR